MRQVWRGFAPDKLPISEVYLTFHIETYHKSPKMVAISLPTSRRNSYLSDIRVILSTGSLWVNDSALTFEMAAEAGYDGIEVMCDERYTTREPSYLQRLSADHGLPIPVLHTPFSSRLPGWKKANTELERVQHTLRLADKIGAERIVMHLPLRFGRVTVSTTGGKALRLPWFSPYRGVKAWIENGGLAQLQAEHSVEIAVENMPIYTMWGQTINPAWWNTIDAWAAIHDYLTLDTTHWATFGIDPIAPLRAAGERVRHIHLSNYDGREHRLPQTGNMDLGAFLQELRAMNFTGTVSVELHPDALAFDSLDATRRKLRETLDFCRQHLS
jgi:sugar phosphate isomerase/epimerase